MSSANDKEATAQRETESGEKYLVQNKQTEAKSLAEELKHDKREIRKTDTKKSAEMSKKYGRDTKTGSSKEKYTFFYGINSPFSQFHPAKFTVDGTSYSCAEQYMMHQKAVTFKDGKMASEIMKTSCPKTMKKLGRKVNNFDKAVWSAKCKGIVKKASVAKYSQNPDLKAELLKTAGTVLAESSPRDRLWGIGLGASNPKAKDKANWRGKNWLGYILTEVRDDMMEQE